MVRYFNFINSFCFLNLLLFGLVSSAFGQTKLNNLLTGDKEVLFNKIIYDGSKVIYSLNNNSLIRSIELYSVPIGGGTSLSLAPVQNNSGIITIKLSSNSLNVVYNADHESIGKFELYSNSVNGGNLIKLNANINGFGGVENDFQISPDNRTVIYRSEQDTRLFTELYAVSINGGSHIKLNGSIVTGGDVDNFKISPDSNYVVYLADQDSDEIYELHSTNLTGGNNVKLNIPITNNDEISNYLIAPDGSKVIYRLRQNNITELYVVPTAGGSSMKLNGNLTSGGNVTDFLISPDGSKVIYRADQDSNGKFELFSVGITGGAPIKLNGNLINDGDVLSFKISPNISTVVYKADQLRNGINEIFSVPIDGGLPVKLNADFPFNSGFVNTYEFSSNGDKVVFQALSQEILNLRELYSVSTDGNNLKKLNPPFSANRVGVHSDFNVSFDNSKVIYASDIETENVRELYQVNIDGSNHKKLSGELVDGGQIFEHQMSSDNLHVTYRGDQDTDAVSELYSTAMSSTLAIDSFDFDKVSIFPNPTYNTLTIKSNVGIKLIEVYNNLGQLVYSNDYNVKINVSSLVHGVYLLKIKTDNGKSLTTKIIKK